MEKIEYCDHVHTADCQQGKDCPCVQDHKCKEGIIIQEKPELIILEELITKALIDKRAKQEADREGKERTWYASSLGSCLRGQYFARLGVTPDSEPDSREMRIFDVGNQMEKWLVDLIVGSSADEIETQTRLFSKKWDISGRPDLVLRRDGKGRIFEIKTKHSKAFWWMKKEGKPMRQHEQQLWFYLKMTGIEEGTIIYLSKDDLAIVEFIVRLDDEKLGKEVISQLKLLNKAWKEKDPTLLPLPEKGSWQEKYCRYHSNCTKEDVRL